MLTSKFKINGMTCESCAEKVTSALKSNLKTDLISVNLKDNSATVESANKVDLSIIQQALMNLPQYSASEFSESADTGINANISDSSNSIVKTYKPLIILFMYIFFISIGFQIYQGHFEYHLFMNHIMAGFFIGLSYFKFLDLKSFAESFSSYDPLAQKIIGYAFIYPFIELVLGLLFIIGFGLLSTNILTVIILSITTFGVIKRLQSKSQIQCACLGTAFSLPLSQVTVFENIMMILMAFYNIKYLIV